MGATSLAFLSRTSLSCLAPLVLWQVERHRDRERERKRQTESEGIAPRSHTHTHTHTNTLKHAHTHTHTHTHEKRALGYRTSRLWFRGRSCHPHTVDYAGTSLINKRPPALGPP